MGFEKIPGWESCYFHKTLKLVLLVYVDDFKMAGKTKNLPEGWNLIKRVLRLDEPTPLGKYLGCGHTAGQVSWETIESRLSATAPLLKRAGERDPLMTKESFR